MHLRGTIDQVYDSEKSSNDILCPFLALRGRDEFQICGEQGLEGANDLIDAAKHNHNIELAHLSKDVEVENDTLFSCIGKAYSNDCFDQ